MPLFPLTTPFVLLTLGLGLVPAGARFTSQNDAPAWNVDYVGHIGGSTWAVAVEGHLAYVGEGPALAMLDVSTPGSPTVLGKTAPLPAIVQGVAVAGGTPYVAADDAGLRVVDVSASTAPAEVGFYDTPGAARGVAVAGGYAYVADWDAGLFILRFAHAPQSWVYLPLVLR